MRVNSVSLTSNFNKSNELIKAKNTQSSPINNNSQNLTFSLYGENKSNAQFAPYFGSKFNLAKEQKKIKPHLHVQQPEQVEEGGYYHEKPGKFKICNIDKLTCPSCGKPMLPRPKYSEFEIKIDKAKNEKEYFDIVDEYQDYLRPTEQKVYQKLKSLHAQKPNASIRNLVIEIRNNELPKLEAKQMEKINQIYDLADECSDRNVSRRLESELFEAEQVIKTRELKRPFRRKTFIQKLQNIPINDKELKEEILKVADTLPTSKEDEAAWFAKYSTTDKKGKSRGSSEIMKSLIRPSFNNTDHMLAQDFYKRDRSKTLEDRMDLEKDSIPNYITMHSGCNTEKTNKTFMEWYKEDPENRTKYMKQYFDEVQEALGNGEIEDERYQDYPEKAKETIKKITNGKVDLA